MSRLVTVAFVLASAASVCRADSDDDTLRFYLSKSDVAFVGSIVSKPQITIDERGVANFYCDFLVADVCHGDAKYQGKVVRVNIHRFNGDGDKRHPLIAKDAECFLFLKLESDGDTPEFVTADFWFGLQHPNSAMTRSLKRIVREQMAGRN